MRLPFPYNPIPKVKVDQIDSLGPGEHLLVFLEVLYVAEIYLFIFCSYLCGLFFGICLSTI